MYLNLSIQCGCILLFQAFLKRNCFSSFFFSWKKKLVFVILLTVKLTLSPISVWSPANKIWKSGVKAQESTTLLYRLLWYGFRKSILSRRVAFCNQACWVTYAIEPCDEIKYKVAVIYVFVLNGLNFLKQIYLSIDSTFEFVHFTQQCR